MLYSHYHERWTQVERGKCNQIGNDAAFFVFCQKLPKVNRNLAEKLIEEKRDTKKHTVSVCYCNLHSTSYSSSSKKPPPPSKMKILVSKSVRVYVE